MDNSKGSTTSWSWDFGDGGKSTAKNPAHTYSQAGAYTVKLAISDGTNSSTKNNSLTVASSSSSKVITASSCALADVQAAIATAKAGDTVVVPAGKATWGSNLVINKGIILKGMGIDKTVITCSYAGTGQLTSPGRYFITYEPSSPSEDQPFRLTGFTFNLNSITNTGGLLLRNTTSYHQTKIRIDHTKWQNVADNGNIMWVYGYFWGVADNNYFDTPGRFRFYALDTTTWANETFNFGSANNFYMEDNFFRCHRGDYWYIEGAGRLALRNNEIHLDVRDDYYPVIDVHGNQSSAWSSAMGSEVYNNVIYFSYGNRIVDMRSGKNLFYNNSLVRTAGSSMLCLREEEPDSNNPPGFAPDGQPQHVSDSYIFRNYLDNNLILNNSNFPYIGGQLYYSELGRNVPMEDKDFWKHVQNFDGSTGVGVGLKSARPIYCKTEGVAYWATDENVLYRWHNGNWELYYIPYIYPHPLRTTFGD